MGRLRRPYRASSRQRGHRRSLPMFSITRQNFCIKLHGPNDGSTVKASQRSPVVWPIHRRSFRCCQCLGNRSLGKQPNADVWDPGSNVQRCIPLFMAALHAWAHPSQEPSTMSDRPVRLRTLVVTSQNLQKKRLSTSLLAVIEHLCREPESTMRPSLAETTVLHASRTKPIAWLTPD